MINLVSKLKKIKISEFILSAKDYLTANFFNKGLSFLTIPIFTRLLTPGDYGIINIFTSIISIFAVIQGLNIHGSIARYYYEEDNDFGSFVFTNMVTVLLANVIFILGFWYFDSFFANLFSVSVPVFVFAIFTSFFTIFMNFYLAYLQASKNSKIYSRISIITNVITVIVSILLITQIEEQKYYGKIIAMLVVKGVIGIWLIYKLLKISEFKYKVEHVIYASKFGIPLIPHALSGIVLAQFDRLIINQVYGANKTGLYSFAYNIGMIMNIIVISSNKAWVPIFYEKYKKKQFDEINDLSKKYSMFIFFAGSGLVLFSIEVVKIIADKAYYEALSLVPIITFGNVFIFIYTLYVNYSFYYKKTGIISTNTLIAGFLNILLNAYFVPKLGYEAAAYTTVVSYIALFVLHYFAVSKIVKVEKTLKILPIFLQMIPLIISLFLFQGLVYYRVEGIISFIIRLSYMIIYMVYLYGKTRKKSDK